MQPAAAMRATNIETAVALVLALVSTTLVSLAYLREHTAVGELPQLSPRRPLRSLRLLLASRAWLVGFAMESGGFALYVAALALALVEGGDQGARGSVLDIGLWLGATCLAAALVVTVGRSLLAGAAADGIAGGLMFSCGDISTKVATQGGARTAFALLAVIGYLLGTSLLQVGYQRGAALTIAGIATLLTNALPIAAGPVLLHETLPGGGLAALRILAFVTVIAGAALLARPRGRGG